MHVSKVDDCAKQHMQLFLSYLRNWKNVTKELAEGVSKPSPWAYTASPHAALANKGVGPLTDLTRVYFTVQVFTLLHRIFSVHPSNRKSPLPL